MRPLMTVTKAKTPLFATGLSTAILALAIMLTGGCPAASSEQALDGAQITDLATHQTDSSGEPTTENQPGAAPSADDIAEADALDEPSDSQAELPAGSDPETPASDSTDLVDPADSIDPTDTTPLDHEEETPDMPTIAELTAILADKQYKLGDILSSGGNDPVTIAGQGHLRLCGFGRFVFVESTSISLGDTTIGNDSTSFGAWAVTADSSGRPQLELRESRVTEGEPGTKRLSIRFDTRVAVVLGNRFTQITDMAVECSRLKQTLDAGRQLVDQAADVFGNKLVHVVTVNPPDSFGRAEREIALRLCRNGSFGCAQGLDEGLSSGPRIVQGSGTWHMQFNEDVGALLVLQQQAGDGQFFAVTFQVGRSADGRIEFVSVERMDSGQPFISDNNARITDDGNCPN